MAVDLLAILTSILASKGRCRSTATIPKLLVACPLTTTGSPASALPLPVCRRRVSGTPSHPYPSSIVPSRRYLTVLTLDLPCCSSTCFSSATLIPTPVPSRLLAFLSSHLVNQPVGPLGGLLRANSLHPPSALSFRRINLTKPYSPRPRSILPPVIVSVIISRLAASVHVCDLVNITDTTTTTRLPR
jgi:hypothetical protein